MKNDMDLLKKKLKGNIQELIDIGYLKEAKPLIEQYKDIDKGDIEAYSMNSVILIMENKFDEAENVLKEGLEIDENNFDLNYNLAYVYYIKDNMVKSLNFYKNAYENAKNITVKEEIKNNMKDIAAKNKLDINIDDFIKRKKCLILCHFFSVYTKNFLEKFQKKCNIEFDILTMDEGYKVNMEKGIIKNVYIYKSIDELTNKINLIRKYDIIHIHFSTPFYGLFANEIRKKCDKLIISIWGSDYYRTTKADKLLQKNLFEIADNINFGNENTLNDFNHYYNKVYNGKLSICRFGLIQLDYIKSLKNNDKCKLKESLGLSADSVVITCGYNASPAQNHLDIIDSILRSREMLPSNCYFIFPMTYGDKNLIVSVRKRLKETKLSYIVYDNFLSEEDTAKLRLISDIMIQVQTTDQLSGSMQEYLYSGNVVITGSWLPYNVFKNKGVHFLEVDTVEQVGKKLIYSIKNLEKLRKACRQNAKAIWNMTSWEKALNNWINVYKS